jgi:hypothetical protein
MMSTEVFWTREGCILFASGVYGLVELIRNWKAQRAEAREEPLVQQGVSG